MKLAFGFLLPQREVRIAQLVENLRRETRSVIANGNGNLPGIPGNLDIHLPGSELQGVLDEIAEPVQQRRAILQARLALRIAGPMDLQADLCRCRPMRLGGGGNDDAQRLLQKRTHRSGELRPAGKASEDVATTQALAEDERGILGQ